MGLKKVDELTDPPQIGKFYLVPTVYYIVDRKISHWPVFGPKHEDAEIIKFESVHYHHDSRFMSTAQIKYLGNYTPRALNVNLAAVPIMECRHAVLNRRVDKFRRENPNIPPVQYRRLLCRREMHEFPTEPDIITTKKGSWVWQLRSVYHGSRIVKTACGRVCPHRGVRLDTIKPDANGIITCPLHGLKFHAATGWALKP